MGSKNDVPMELEPPAVTVKVPKRVLHFSDGVVEEFSDDEEVDGVKTGASQDVVDPKTLTWGPWMAYQMWSAGSTTLSACDYLGESLASILGITTPKYHFEIEEYKRREAAKKAYQEKCQGWSEPIGGGERLFTKEPPVDPVPV